MDKVKFAILLAFWVTIQGELFAQVSGNASYRSNQMTGNYAREEIDNQSTTIVIRALAQIPAQSYLAIFSDKQTGSNTDEIVRTNQAKLQVIKTALEQSQAISSFEVDLLTFLPTFSIQNKKSFFSENKEKPIGYELQQNILVEYKKADQLPKIISQMAQNGIYNILKVEYQNPKLQVYIDSLRVLSYEMLKKRRLTLKQSGVEFNDLQTVVSENCDVYQPSEGYSQVTIPRLEYDESKTTPSLNANGEIGYVFKNMSLSNFDIVLYAKTNEPTIQVVFELIQRIPVASQVVTKYFIQSGNGFTPIDPKK